MNSYTKIVLVSTITDAYAHLKEKSVSRIDAKWKRKMMRLISGKDGDFCDEAIQTTSSFWKKFKKVILCSGS